MALRCILVIVCGLASYQIADSNTCWSRSATLPFFLTGAACSNDGSDLIVATSGDFLYLSYNYGSGLTSVFNQADWQGVAISSNGNCFAAVADGGSNVYVSSNPLHWTPIAVSKPGPPGFTAVAIPAGTTNGFPVFVAQGRDSGLVYEVDSSSSVTARPGQSHQHWIGIALSADGSKGYAAGGGPDIGFIYRFNAGGPWVQAFGPKNWTGRVHHLLSSFNLIVGSDRLFRGRQERCRQRFGRLHLRLQGLRLELGNHPQ